MYQYRQFTLLNQCENICHYPAVYNPYTLTTFCLFIKSNNITRLIQQVLLHFICKLWGEKKKKKHGECMWFFFSPPQGVLLGLMCWNIHVGKKLIWRHGAGNVLFENALWREFLKRLICWVCGTYGDLIFLPSPDDVQLPKWCQAAMR